MGYSRRLTSLSLLIAIVATTPIIVADAQVPPGGFGVAQAPPATTQPTTTQPTTTQPSTKAPTTTQPEQRRAAPRGVVQPKALLVPFPWRGLEKNGDDVDMPWSSGTVWLNGVRFNLVPTVENVRLDRKDNGLSIEARGLVPTGGWGDALLVPAVLIRKPEDGIYDLILYGRPPNGTATQAISEITGTMNWDKIPSGARGVRVWSGSNCLEVFLPDVPIKKTGMCEGG